MIIDKRDINIIGKKVTPKERNLEYWNAIYYNYKSYKNSKWYQIFKKYKHIKQMCSFINIYNQSINQFK